MLSAEDCLESAGDTELAIDMLEMRLEGVHGDEQLRGQLTVVDSSCKGTENHELRYAERFDMGIGRRKNVTTWVGNRRRAGGPGEVGQCRAG